MDALKVQEISVDSLLTSYQVGALLQVNPSSVNKWVRDGRILAFRTPGGHRRIRAADLVAFLSKHKMPIPQSLGADSHRRVLIVEHDARHLETLQLAFGSLGTSIDAVYVNNGVDAMVQVGAFRPHVVMLDADMPHFDSFDVCRRLLAGHDTAAIEVLLACQQLSDNAVHQAQAAGVKACISKPVSPQVILNALRLSEQKSAV